MSARTWEFQRATAGFAALVGRATSVTHNYGCRIIDCLLLTREMQKHTLIAATQHSAALVNLAPLR